MRRLLLLAILLVLVVLGISILAFWPLRFSARPFVEVLRTGLHFPTAIAFLNDGRILYNEKNSGNIKVMLRDGTVLPSPFATMGPLPPSVESTEEGLLGIALDPNFGDNHYVYVYWTYWNGTYKHARITKLTANGNQGTISVTIFDFTDPNGPAKQPPGGPSNHNGGYIKFGPDGKLYAEVGDFCSWDCLGKPLAQDLATYAGKILRMNPDGSVPSDNPFTGSLVYSYGYRNGFGMDFHPNGNLVATMAGPNCCDRIFYVNAGANFGWPTCGTQTLQKCATLYTTSIYQTGSYTVTPTGIAYSPNPNVLYFGEFNTGNLVQLVLNSEGSVAQTSVVASGYTGGIIAVERAPDGRIYFSTADEIYRLVTPQPDFACTRNPG